jgi:Mg-chelatase subunit ChlD
LEPRFLPDLPTGGDVVFLAPEAFQSLELRCDFPNARAPGGKEAVRPAGIALALEGARPELADRKPLASLKDDNFKVAVVAQNVQPSFAGEEAGGGKKFLVLDLVVENGGRQGEFFQTLQQLKYAAEDGEEIEIDGSTSRGARAPADLLWIPAGERRAFQVAFRIGERETKPRLAYAGVSLASVLELKPLDAPAPVAAVAEEGTPKEEPAKEPAKEPAPEEMASQDKEPVQAKEAPVQAEEQPVRPKEKPVALKPPLVPKGLAGVGLTADQVNMAIDRGAAFLWNYIKTEDLQKKKYKFGGDQEHILAGLALVHSGGEEKFPDFKRELEGYLSRIDVSDMGTYEVGILGMLIDARGDPAHLPLLGQAVRYILEGQGAEGAWNYNSRLPEGVLEDPTAHRVLQVSGGRPLDGSEEAEKGMERVTDWKNGSDGDNSVSQYAVLGLHAATSMGLKVSTEAWKRSVSAYIGRQDEAGGWGYTSGSSYGSMSCAGVCSLAIGSSALGEKGILSDPRIRRGLDWLAGHFSVSEHPESNAWLFYYLYSLERVGRILNIDFIGENEWYPLGARHLLSIQKPDGSWVGDDQEQDPRLATSFALLFLTRATQSLKGELQRGGQGTLKTGIAMSRQNRFYFILDASGSMLAEMDGRQKFDIARDAVASLVKEMPPESAVALRVYGHRKRSIDAGASEDTEMLIPMGPLVERGFLAKCAALRARGKTPLALSLELAARDLAHTREDQPVVAVLLTDGGEDTLPRKDPLKAAEEFGKVKNVTLHVVGFDIGREDWSRELEAICSKARGRYWPARDASALVQELRTAVFGLPERFEVLDATGREVARGAFGESKRLPEGKYRLRALARSLVFEESFWINTETVTRVTFNADSVVSLKAPAGKPEARPEAKPEAKAEGKPQAKPEGKAKDQPAPQFCTGCGKALKPGDLFCSSCGRKAKP